MPRDGGGATFDAIVIGGGIVGAAAAAHLALTGRRVALIESERIAAGASGRNSGVVQHPFDPDLVALHLETVDLYRELEGFTLPSQPSGLLSVTHDVEGARRLAAALGRSYPEMRPTFHAPGDVQALEPGLAPAVAACRLEIGYPVEPAAATNAYAAWAMRLGVLIRIGASAAIWRSGGRALGVTLDGAERLAAGDVVVAAGPWTPDIIDTSGGWRPLRRLWGVVVAVDLDRPPHHVLEEAEISIEPGVANDDGGISFSLVTAGGSSSLGSTFLPDEPDIAELAPRLVARGSTFVPRLADARVGTTRRCARPLSFDGRPLIGRVPGTEGLWVAAGHGPWGISTGPASGRLVATLVDGAIEAPPPAFDPVRFRPPNP